MSEFDISQSIFHSTSS